MLKNIGVIKELFSDLSNKTKNTGEISHFAVKGGISTNSSSQLYILYSSAQYVHYSTI